MKNKLRINVLVDLVVWWLVFASIKTIAAYMSTKTNSNIIEYSIQWNAIISSATLLALFTVSHYYFLFVQFFQKKKTVQYIIGCIVLLALLVIGQAVILNVTVYNFNSFTRGVLWVTPAAIFKGVYIHTFVAIFYSMIRADMVLLKQRGQLKWSELRGFIKQRIWYKILINFIAWWVGVSAIAGLENLLQYWDEPKARQTTYWLTLGAMSGIIAVNSVAHYYILFVKYFQKRKYAQYVLGVLAFLTILVLADAYIFLDMGNRFKKFDYGFLFAVRIGLARCAILYTPAAIFYSLIKGNVKLLRRKKELENQQLQSSIAVLRNQLDPHFLFNSLNTIYATAKNEQAVKTSASIEELTGLFRYSLEEAGQEKVPVEKELAFIDKYLHLQQLRLPENDQVKIHTDIQWDKQPIQIAPMLLLPFIENAFKYGISYQEPSEVSISIQIKEGVAKVDIGNTNHAGKVQTTSTGIGKENALSRLELQYTDRYTFSEEENGYYKVSLTIQL